MQGNSATCPALAALPRRLWPALSCIAYFHVVRLPPSNKIVFQSCLAAPQAEASCPARLPALIIKLCCSHRYVINQSGFNLRTLQRRLWPASRSGCCSSPASCTGGSSGRRRQWRCGAASCLCNALLCTICSCSTSFRAMCISSLRPSSAAALFLLHCTTRSSTR